MSNVAVYDEDARRLARASQWAKTAGIQKELAESPETILAVQRTLESYGLKADNVFAINAACHFFMNRLEPSAQFYASLAWHNGYRLLPRIYTRDLAVVHATFPTDPSLEAVQIEYNLEDAIHSHKLDSWVEAWVPSGREGKRVFNKYVIRVNGEPGTWAGELRAPLPETLPNWVQAEVDGNHVKVFEAWWSYRKDMMWKSALKRSVKIVCPHILLPGSDADHSFGAMGSSPPASEPIGADDDGVIDVEAVDEGPTPARVHDDAPESRGWAPGEEPF